LALHNFGVSYLVSSFVSHWSLSATSQGRSAMSEGVIAATDRFTTRKSSPAQDEPALLSPYTPLTKKSNLSNTMVETTNICCHCTTSTSRTLHFLFVCTYQRLSTLFVFRGSFYTVHLKKNWVARMVYSTCPIPRPYRTVCRSRTLDRIF
jgi:hypothetical protein